MAMAPSSQPSAPQQRLLWLTGATYKCLAVLFDFLFHPAIPCPPSPVVHPGHLLPPWFLTGGWGGLPNLSPLVTALLASLPSAGMSSSPPVPSEVQPGPGGADINPGLGLDSLLGWTPGEGGEPCALARLISLALL